MKKIEDYIQETILDALANEPLFRGTFTDKVKTRFLNSIDDLNIYDIIHMCKKDSDFIEKVKKGVLEEINEKVFRE